MGWGVVIRICFSQSRVKETVNLVLVFNFATRALAFSKPLSLIFYRLMAMFFVFVVSFVAVYAIFII